MYLVAKLTFQSSLSHFDKFEEKISPFWPRTLGKLTVNTCDSKENRCFGTIFVWKIEAKESKTLFCLLIGFAYIAQSIQNENYAENSARLCPTLFGT